MSCITHHMACDCREHNFATLQKATLDLAMEMDWLKNDAGLDEEEAERISSIINRAYVAIEVCQFKGGQLAIEMAARLTGCAEETESNIEQAVRFA